LAAVAAINFTVDVNRIYHTDDPEEQARVIDYAHRLLKSKDGMVDVLWDRALKWELARQSDAECYVTGSSRTKLFGINQLRILGSDCSSVVNLAVNGAGFEDFVTAAGLIADKPLLKTVYVGVDPWALRYGADARWTGFERIYYSSRRRLNLPDNTRERGLEAFTNLFNGQYLLANLNVITVGRVKIPFKNLMPEGAGAKATANLLQSDGSVVYAKKQDSLLPLPEEKIGNGSAKIQPPFLEGRATADFESILYLLSKRGVRVVLLLAPYHPKVLRCQSQKACSALIAVEEWVRGLALRHGYQVIGSFDPRRLGVSSEFFRDDLHMEAEAIKYLVPGQAFLK
jgi:hypothetical protein